MSSNESVKKIFTTLSPTEIEELRKSQMMESYFTSIHVSDFLDANRKEIELLETSMKGKPSVLNKHGMRLFQILPRHLRRRQMSHNMHLLPAYLRKKAKYEYSNTVLKRKRRKLKRWKWNKMILQQERSKDPVSILFSENSFSMKMVLEELLEQNPNISKIQDAESFEAFNIYFEDEIETLDELEIKNTEINNLDDLKTLNDIIFHIHDEMKDIIESKGDEKEPDQIKVDKEIKENVVENIINEENEQTKPIYIGAKRLVSHLFHAKRSHMKEAWGNLLPWASYQKLFRVTHQFYKSHCTITDHSFYIALQLNGALNDILDILQAFSNERLNLLQSEPFLKGNKRIAFEFVDKTFGVSYGKVDAILSSKAITNFIFNSLVETEALQSDHLENDDFRSCLIWLHPASLPYSYNRLVEESKFRNLLVQYRNDLCRFIMRGPHVSTVLCRNHILSLPPSNNNSEKLKFWEELKSKNVTVPKDFALSLKIRHPLCPDEAPTLELLENIENTQNVNSTKSKIKNEDVSNYSLNSLCEDNQNIWIKDHYRYVDSYYDSATYSHRTNDKAQRNRIQVMKGKKDSNILNESKKDPKSLENLWTTTFFDIMLLKYKNGDDDFGSGWDIICPREVGASLMYKLGKTHHILLVPIMDQIRMETEQGLPTYPFDFPETFSFYTLQNSLLQKMVFKKRLSNLSWGSIFKNCGVQDEDQIEFIRTGAPKSHTSEESEKVYSENGKIVRFHMIHLEFEFGNSPIRKGTIYLPSNESQLEHILDNPHQAVPFDNELRCVGFVTSAIQSLQRGVGFGIGYIHEDCAVFLQDNKFTVLLYRDEINSPSHVYPVKCSLSIENKFNINN